MIQRSADFVLILIDSDAQIYILEERTLIMNIPDELLNAIRWSARIICIIFILFISMFAFDVFDQAAGFWRTAGALLLHLLPSFVMISVLVISWRKPLVGGIVFLVIAISYIIWSSGRTTYAIIAVPIFLISALFFLSWILEKAKAR